MDTSTNTHVMLDLVRFEYSTIYHGSHGVTSAGGSSLLIDHIGPRHITTSSGIFYLNNLLRVSLFNTRLLSVHLFIKESNCALTLPLRIFR